MTLLVERWASQSLEYPCPNAVAATEVLEVMIMKRGCIDSTV